MFFEGSEKKTTLTIDSSKTSLLTDYDNDFWHRMVECCQAKIISKISNQYCTAYLLSESSLFVWDDHFVILTCGKTSLVNAIDFFVKHVNPQNILSLNYQRKNELFAHAQPSCFNDDAKILQGYFQGQATRFGPLDSHHNYLYHLEHPLDPDCLRTSYELLCYQIGSQASGVLCQPNLTTSQIRTFLRLEQLLPQFQLDDFVFDPFGYSLNAIAGNKYLTIHVTPQENSSYVSIETNLNLLILTPLLLDILAPVSFDIIAFNEAEFSALTSHYIPDHYIAQEQVASKLASNEQVNFATYIKPSQQTNGAYRIDI